VRRQRYLENRARMSCRRDTDMEDTKNMDDAKLLERLREVFPDCDMQNFNVLDLVYAEGSPLLALLYSRLFWPDFVEIDGMVFLKETMEDSDDLRRLREAFDHYGHDPIQTEQSFNLVEVEDLFGRRRIETSEDEDRELLERMRQMWLARLTQLFPARRFRVELVEPEHNGGSMGLIFWTERNRSS
jgi:hypothetical protein